MKRIILSIILIVFALNIVAQEKREPSIPVETLFGNKRVALSMSINKPIAGKFRYSNISSASAYYKLETGRPEVTSINSLVYQFHKNIGVSAGAQYHFARGFMPSVAVHFSYANPTWLLALNPYYHFLPWSNFETVGIVEYKPSIAQNWRLFTRLQGFYSHDLKMNERERTMFYFRLGLTYQKYTFGFGGNIDGYRPERDEVQNYGGFFRVDI